MRTRPSPIHTYSKALVSGIVLLAACSAIGQTSSAQMMKPPRAPEVVPTPPAGAGQPGVDIRAAGDRDASGPIVNVSVKLNTQAETAIAINPTNPDNIVIFSNENSINAIFRSYSFDGGVTWTHGDVLSPACCDGQAAFDAFGNLFFVYITASGGIALAASSDGGVSFGAPTILSANGGDQPSLAVGDGSLWVDWNQSGSMRAAGAPVTGLGSFGPFGAAQVVPSGSGSFGGITAGPGPNGGKVMITYQFPYSGQGPSTIYANVDADGLGPGNFGSRFIITATNVGGFDAIPPQFSRTVNAEAGLAWDATGGPFDNRAYLVYTDETVNENNDTDIMLRTSDDDGATWSAPVRVNDDPADPVRSQFLPFLALDATTGAVAIGWQDSRNDNGVPGTGGTNAASNDDAEYYASCSIDGGATWAPNVRMSGGFSNVTYAGSSVGYGDYVGTAAYGGVFRPAWADNSNSTGDNPDGTLNRFDVYSSPMPIVFDVSDAGDPFGTRTRAGAGSRLTLSSPSLNVASGALALRYRLAEAARVRLTLHDVVGREVASLFDGESAAGWHTLAWNGAGASGARLPGGVYFLRLADSGESRTQRILQVN